MINNYWKLIVKELTNFNEIYCPPLVRCYFLSIEDRRFFNHNGIDYWCTLKAMCKYLLGLKTGGGSTIEQQLVRVITKENKRNLKRKLIELFLARKLAKKYNKNFILNYYLSICYFGTGIYGISQAANKIFGKSCQDLSNFESSFIASLAKYPRPLIENEYWHNNHSEMVKFALNFLNNSIYPSIQFMNFNIGIKSARLIVISTKLIEEYTSIQNSSSSDV